MGVKCLFDSSINGQLVQANQPLSEKTVGEATATPTASRVQEVR